VTPRDLLLSGASELGISLTPEQVNAVFLYLAELHKWNRKMNLTAITLERDVIIKHILDSLAYTTGFEPTPGLRLLDVGSGAGFPALPIKIAFPGIMITMVDSVKKKAAFLRHIVRTLQLAETDVIDTRVEDLPARLNSSFDIVTARAFADMGAALKAGIPLLKPGGVMVLSRGPDENLEIAILESLHAEQGNIIDLTLPHSDYKRAIWVFRKVGQQNSQDDVK